MKKITAFILVCVMLLSTATPITANASNVVQPRFTYITEVSADIDVSAWGIAACTGSVLTRTENPVKITIRLQEFDGSNWMTIQKWDITGTGSVYATKNYAIYSGSSYCVHVTAYVYDTNGNCLETTTKTQYIDY